MGDAIKEQQTGKGAYTFCAEWRMLDCMGQTVRIVAIFLVVGPLSAMFAEPFFEAVFNQLGVNTEDWAVPVVSMLASIFASDWFRALALLAIGTGMGIWVHALANRFDRKTNIFDEAPSLRELLMRLEEFRDTGVRLRNELEFGCDDDFTLEDYIEGQATFMAWDSDVVSKLCDDRINVSDMSTFKTLHKFEIEGEFSPKRHLLGMWDEKISRLLEIMRRLES